MLLKEFQHVEHALRRLDRGLHLRKVAGRIAGAIRAVERTQTGCRACIRQIFLRHRHRHFPCCATRRFSHQPYCSGERAPLGIASELKRRLGRQFGFHSSSRPSARGALPSLEWLPHIRARESIDGNGRYACLLLNAFGEGNLEARGSRYQRVAARQFHAARRTVDNVDPSALSSVAKATESSIDQPISTP